MYRVLLVLILGGAVTPSFADEDGIDFFALGERIYSTGPDSCRSCHGADGAGTDRSSVDLRDPSSWKSVMYENAMRSKEGSIEQGSVTKAVIALGARSWNEENFTIFREHWDSKTVSEGKQASPDPFDEEMVGINGPSRKSHENYIRRALRKAGKGRVSISEIEDIMAVAVLSYVREEFSGTTN
jgi:hypothetical protein